MPTYIFPIRANAKRYLAAISRWIPFAVFHGKVFHICEGEHAAQCEPTKIIWASVGLVFMVLLVGISSLVRPTIVNAASASSTINFQARLENSSGAIAPDGTYNVEFKIYNTASGGSAEWTEDYTYNSGAGASDARISVSNGYLTVNLGSLCPFAVGTCQGYSDSAINWDQQQYLTMNIGGTGSSGSFPTMGDGEMSPRLAITSVPYAFRAGSVAQTDGSGNEGTLSFGSVTNNPAIGLPNASGTVCLQGASGCGFATGSGTAFLQGGNSFGVQAELGTNDANNLAFRTNNTDKLVVDTAGNLQFQQASTLSVASAASGTQLTVLAGSATSGTNAGGNLVLQGGAGASTGPTGSVIVKANGNDSTAAFQIQNASSSVLLFGDTKNMRLGIDASVSLMGIPTSVVASACTSSCSTGTLTNGATYKYKVTAIDSVGGETTVSATEGSTAATATKVINVTWTGVTGASGYRIYRTAANGASGTETLYDTSISASYVDTGSGPAPGTAQPASNTAYTSATVSNTNGQLTIGGNGTPTGQLYVSGTVPSSATATASTGTNPNGVFVQGHYAYVVNQNGGTLGVYDISNPATPTLINTIGTGMSSPHGVSVQGRYAYVINYGNNTLEIIDVSNPYSMSVVGTLSLPSSSPESIYVQGHYAYVGGFSAASYIVDISNPAAPAIDSRIAVQGYSVFVQSHYLFLDGTTQMYTYDISNPYSPSQVASNTNAAGYSVYLQGRYAYVAATTSQLKIFDEANPSSTAAAVGTVSTGSCTGGQCEVYLQGRYAYVVSWNANTFQVYDVSNPFNPVAVGTAPVITGSNPDSIFVYGRYAYTTEWSSNALQIFDLGGTYTQQLQSGGTETGTLQVDSNAQVAGDANIQGGVSIGQNAEIGGSLGVSGQVLLQNSSNSNTALQVGNALGLGLLNVDTSNGRVGVASLSAPASPTATPALGGSLGASLTYYFKVTAIDGSGGETSPSSEVNATTSSGCTTSGSCQINVNWTAVSGAASYRVYYGTVSGAESNYFTSATNSYTLTTTTGSTAGSPPVLSNAFADRFSNTGTALIQTLTNSAAAFQIQNAAGTNLLQVDTSGNNIYLAGNTNATINVGATGSAAFTTTVNVASSTGAAQTVTVGSTATTSALTLQAGSNSLALTTGTTTGNITLTTNNAASSIIAKSSTNNVGAFQIQNAASTALLNVDTTNSRIGLGKLATPSSTPLAASGGSLSPGNYYIRVTAIDAAGGESAASTEFSATASGTCPGGGLCQVNITWPTITGAVSYRVYYGTSAGAEANYFTTVTNSYTLSTTTGSTAGSPPTAASAFVNQLAGSSSGTNYLTVTTVRTASNSTTAFQVQNAAGTAVLTADTQNQQVIVRSGSSDASKSANLFTGFNTVGGWTNSGSGSSMTSTHTNGGGTSALTTTFTPTSGTTYEVSYSYNNCSSTNTLGITMGGQTLENTATCVGSDDVVITASSTAALTFTPANTYAGTVSSVAIYALTQTNSVLTVQNSSGTTTLQARSSGSATNLFIGLNAGQNNTSSGTYNTALGDAALSSNTTGLYNTATGTFALQTNTTGNYNTAYGGAALPSNTTGTFNAAFGLGTLDYNTTGSNNTALGSQALTNNTTGSNNTGIGYDAGYQDSGNNFKTTATLQNATAIGAYAQVQANNSIVLGSIDTATKVGIGTTIPLNTFSVSPVDLNSNSVTASQSNGSGTITASSTIFSSSNVGEEFIWADGTQETITAYTDTTHVTGSSTTITETNQYFRTHHIGLQVTSSGNVYIQTSSTTAFQVQNAAGASVVTEDTTANKLSVNGALNLAQVSRPSAAPTTADNGAGSLSANTYYYVYTYVTANGETEYSAESTGLAIAASHNILVTVANSPNNLVTAKKIYRATSSGGPYNLVGTINDNTTTSFTDSNTSPGAAAKDINTTANLQVNGLSVLITDSTNYNTSLGAGGNFQNNTTGQGNTALGYASLITNTTGSDNTGVGDGALNANTTGSNNTGVGWWALIANTTGSGNTANGIAALYSNTTGSNNSALGYEGLFSNTTGSNDTAVGYKAGYQDFGTTGLNGRFSTLATLQNATAIGTYAQVQANNTISLGSVDEATQVVVGATEGVGSNSFGVSPVDLNSNTITASQTNGSSTITASAAIFSSSNVGEEFIWADGTQETITAYTDTTHVTGSSTTITETNQYFRTHHIGLQVTSSGNTYVQNGSTTAFQVQSASASSVLNVDTTNNRTNIGGANLVASLGVTNGATLSQAAAIINQANTSQNILQMQSNGTTVATFAGNGALTLTPTTIAGSLPSLVQNPTPTSQTTATSSTQAFGSNVSSGDLIVVLARVSGTASISDTLGTSFTQYANFGASSEKYIWYGYAPSGGADTITVNGTVSATIRIAAQEWSGVAASNPLYALNTLNVAAYVSNWSISTSSAVAAGDAVYGGMSGSDTNSIVAGTSAPNSDFIQLTNANGSIAHEDSQSWSGGVATATFSNSGGGQEDLVTFGIHAYGASTANALVVNTSTSLPLLTVNGNTDTINIGANGTNALSSTVNIGTSAASSNFQTVNIGSALGASAVNLQSGSGNLALSTGNSTGNITLTTNNASSSIIAKSSTNSTTAFQVQNASNNSVLTVDTTDSTIGINIAPTATGGALQIGGTASDVSNGSFINVSGTLASATNNQTGIRSAPTISPGAAAGSSVIFSGANFTPTTSSSNINGGGVSGLAGFFGGGYYTGTGTLSNAYGAYLQNSISAAGTITNSYGLYVDNPIKSAGTITNNYGIYINGQSNGTTNYAIYSQGGQNYFGGNVNTNSAYQQGGTSGITLTCSSNQAVNGMTIKGGIITAGTCSLNAADYAEAYNSTDTLSAGEIVATDPVNYPNVLRSTGANQNNIIGVVSTNPYQVIGTGDAPNGYPIALNGRVPVKVNLEGGVIHPGDKITSSSVAGVGMKATTAGMIVGTALTGYDGSQASATVEVFIHTSYYDPTSGNSIQGTDASFTTLNVSGVATITDLAVQSETVRGNLTVQGLATVVDIEVGGHIISAGGQPTVQPKTALGAGASVTISGTDTTGTITITTGTVGLSAGDLLQIIFSKAYGTAPHVVLSPSNDAASTLHYFKGATSVTDFMVDSHDVPAANTTYEFDYFIAQ